MLLLLRLAFCSTLLALVPTLKASAPELVLRPSGKLLFQPQLLWSNSESTLQGTGYVIEHSGKYYAVTSIHYLDFNAGGLRSATWLDVYTEQPLATLRTSLGRPLRTTITQPRHTADDFLLLPLSQLPENGTALQLEQVERYAAGTRLWFPNKNRNVEIGYQWFDATVLEDAGYYIKVQIRDAFTLESQSGSPVLNAETGKVMGMLRGGETDDGKVVLTLCPARSLVKYLSRPHPLTPLLTSISRRR